jgi:hypothetical protein
MAMRHLWLAISVFMVTACTTVPEAFHPSNPLPPSQISHELWESMVSAQVRDGRVDYSGIRHDARFPTYVASLDRVDPSQLSTYDRLAFWINAYNAFAVKGILDGYSPATLFGRYRYFIGREYQVGGRSVNLYDLERSILIAQFQEPRIHFAIVCASASCPKLQPWAYHGRQLESQLEQVTREFVNDPARNRFDRSTRTAHLSMIFKWFEQDFARHSGTVLGFVGKYVQDAQLQQELRAQPYKVEFLDYDWSLNGPPPER